jgi:hypothetical protein
LPNTINVCNFLNVRYHVWIVIALYIYAAVTVSSKAVP